MDIIISPEGQIRFIYSDDLVGLLDEGEARTVRASHVEPVPGGWAADLSPVGGPTLERKLRQEALEAEVQWLEKHGVPTPQQEGAQAPRRTT